MPLDVQGRIRATIKGGTCVRAPPQRVREPAVPPQCQGLGLVIFAREPGILSRRKSPAHAAQVPAFVHTTVLSHACLRVGSRGFTGGLLSAVVMTDAIATISGGCAGCATSNLSSSGQPQLRNYPGFLQ